MESGSLSLISYHIEDSINEVNPTKIMYAVLLVPKNFPQRHDFIVAVSIDHPFARDILNGYYDSFMIPYKVGAVIEFEHLYNPDFDHIYATYSVKEMEPIDFLIKQLDTQPYGR